MKSFAELHQAVHGVIAGKRIGTPVFVRYLLQGLDPPNAVLPRLAQAAAAVRDWLGQPLDRVYTLGPEGGQAALSLEFHGGATALVVYAHGQPRGSGVDVMVLGNHGAIYA